ncbi:MAG: S8 family serine peptidase [Candidatus Lokiarchaeota archaeon]|nr:S8 family serine peptidase [Candidatus Lokiarchaeota archaeon]
MKKLFYLIMLMVVLGLIISGCIPVMEKLGLVNPVNEEQLSPEKGGTPNGLLKVLIGFKEKPGPAEQALVNSMGGKIKYTYNFIPAMAASIPEKAIEALKKNPNITDVELDGQVYALDQEIPWGVDRIDAEVVHSDGSGNKGTGLKVAVIDTGIDYDHPDLDGNYMGGYDFVNLDKDPMDDEGHGTHVAGIIAAEDDGNGVVGVAPEAKLYALKVLDDTGSGYLSDVIYGIQWATDPNGDGSADDRLDIINMSLGADVSNIFLKWACNLAYRDGLLLVAAAGNGGSVIYPAAYARVIAVSATDYDYVNHKDILADFSSTGSEVELAAPGVNINSTLLGGGYITHDGTSMASPHVAGTAALVWAANPSWSNTEVRSHLQGTTEDVSLAGTEQGYGLVDAENAVLGTTNGNNLPTQATGTITGTVTDKNTGSVIEGAAVSADGFGDLTEANGIYSLNDIPVGSYTVTASKTGYTEESQVVDVSKDNTTVVDFSLNPESTPTNTMHIHSIDVSSKTAGPNVNAIVEVTILDKSDSPVEGATVSGVWSEATNDIESGVTGTDGKVSFKSNRVKNPETGTTFTFTVNDVTKSGWIYESSDNTETFDSIIVP